ncbi:MAG: hypothetical protein EZS28_025697 [Streblomastix strix]|uniref:Uncharacterized protein n=1 Tax=Streblomastix strix TaxID=222440 RepID=A0A5J4V8G1_9EUKA|nr:MAG: hypothetical protein EZS28_025697 [Streblomastix strix]
MRAPTTIRNQMDLADYKRFIRNHIIQMQERTIMDTKEKIVGIFSIMIQVFRLPHAGTGCCGACRTIPSLKKHIMRLGIRYIDPEKNNQNLCFFLLFKDARKIIDSNKYEDETVQQHYEVPVIGFNSSKFDVALILKNFQSDEWLIIKYLGSGSNAKQIIVKHNISGIKLRFIDAMIYSTKMKLKQFIKDLTPKTATTEKSEIPTKLKFPYEFINYDNYVQELDKSEPFPIEAWDYLRHYNLEDTRLMIEPFDYLIDMFFNYKIDMLQFMSMSACASAIKYALTYWDFKLDQDYTPKDDYASFILTQNYWNIKVQNYLEQDKKRNRDTSNNIKESDCAFYRKLFLSTGCHICKARFTSKNPPTLDTINNNMGHSADNRYELKAAQVHQIHSIRYEQDALYLWRY